MVIVINYKQWRKGNQMHEAYNVHGSLEKGSTPKGYNVDSEHVIRGGARFELYGS